jgi:hypothetical protein
MANPDTLTPDKLRASPPYFRFAFANPYNLALLVGGLAAAGLTLNPLLAVAAVGAEALWLLHAPGSRTLQRLLWDKRLRALCEELEQRELEQKIASLNNGDQKRVRLLISEKTKIDQLAAQNPSFAGDLLRDELTKSEILVHSFVDLAATCTRYERYLAGVDVKDLERERQMWETRLKQPSEHDTGVNVAKKNLDVILKRTEKIHDIRQHLGLARDQLDLIENTFNLIADQIVTMQSPRELSGQLDDLMSGVEAVQQATSYTERMLA